MSGKGDSNSKPGPSDGYTPYTITSRGTNSQVWQSHALNFMKLTIGRAIVMTLASSLLEMYTTTVTQLGFSNEHEENIADWRQDGSYYYKNGNNSTYHNDGQGSATYTAPNGAVYMKGDNLAASSSVSAKGSTYSSQQSSTYTDASGNTYYKYWCVSFL